MKTKVTVYAVRRTDLKDSADTNLIYGAPGSVIGDGYPSHEIFINSDKRVAKKFAAEMNNRFPDTQLYAAVKIKVKVQL
jgi:hypothetical protein